MSEVQNRKQKLAIVRLVDIETGAKLCENHWNGGRVWELLTMNGP